MFKHSSLSTARALLFPLLLTGWVHTTFANNTQPVYTDGGGHPVSSPYDYQRVGTRGPLLLQDFHLIDLLTHFGRERIPERVVHAKGSGAHGYFEVTRDVSNITMAAPFSEGVGTKVPLTMRFSTVAGESGTPDTNRDPRGFAIKMRTSMGIWDWVFNNTPVFFLRDPTKFPLFIHSQKRDPQTNLRSPTIQWDYWSQNQESVYQVMILFSNRGTPRSWAQMHGWSGHTYKWVAKDGSWHYVKIKVISQQGIDNLSAEEALALAASNPDHNTQDLRDRIAAKNFPTWHVAIQTMTPEEGQKYKYDVNDLTKVWPEDEFPLLEVGKIVLDKNPENWFAEIEQLSFSPGNMPPGAEPSNDPVLQSRLFAYSDTARHRLGPNHLEIPINCPLAVHNFQRAGWMRVDGGAGTLPPSAPNYPSSFQPPVSFPQRPYNLSQIADPIVGPATVLSSYRLSRMDFEQPNALYNKEFTEVERQSLVANVITALNSVTVQQVKQRSVDMFACVDKNLGNAIGKGIQSNFPAQNLGKVIPVRSNSLCKICAHPRNLVTLVMASVSPMTSRSLIVSTSFKSRKSPSNGRKNKRESTTTCLSGFQTPPELPSLPPLLHRQVFAKPTLPGSNMRDVAASLVSPAAISLRWSKAGGPSRPTNPRCRRACCRSRSSQVCPAKTAVNLVYQGANSHSRASIGGAALPPKPRLSSVHRSHPRHGWPAEEEKSVCRGLRWQQTSASQRLPTDPDARLACLPRSHSSAKPPRPATRPRLNNFPSQGPPPPSRPRSPLPPSPRRTR